MPLDDGLLAPMLPVEISPTPPLMSPPHASFFKSAVLGLLEFHSLFMLLAVLFTIALTLLKLRGEQAQAGSKGSSFEAMPLTSNPGRVRNSRSAKGASSVNGRTREHAALRTKPSTKPSTKANAKGNTEDCKRRRKTKLKSQCSTCMASDGNACAVDIESGCMASRTASSALCRELLPTNEDVKHSKPSSALQIGPVASKASAAAAKSTLPIGVKQRDQHEFTHCMRGASIADAHINGTPASATDGGKIASLHCARNESLGFD